MKMWVEQHPDFPAEWISDDDDSTIRDVSRDDVVVFAREYDKVVAERDRLRDTLQLLYDTCDAVPGSPKFEDYALALHCAEAELQGDSDEKHRL